MVSPIRRILSYLGPYRWLSIYAILMLVASVAVELMIPQMIRRIIDEGIALRDMNVILATTALMIGAALIEAVLTIGNTILSVKAAQSLAADVRAAIFHKIQSYSFGNLDRFQTGQLIVRLTSDVNMIQMMILMGLRIFTRAPLMIVGSIALMVITSRDLAMISLLLLPLTLILSGAFIVKAQPMFMEVQKRLDKLNTVLQENLAGVRVVKAFIRMRHEAERFDEANINLSQQSIRVTRMLSVLFPSMALIINLSMISIVWFGGQQTVLGKFTVGEIMAFINYLQSASFPLLFLAMMAGQLSAANASAQRIYEVLDFQPEVQDRPGAKPLTDVKGKVAFENVCFSYTKNCAEPVLDEINLVAEPGQTVAILGATGSGKSTLINLIPRFYEVTRGRLTIDGVDIRDITLDSLRANIGVALQDVVLFSGTIKDNIRYGRPDASEDEVVAAAKAAQAHDFIMSFPDGYDSDVGQRGVNLSGGQKQRISIARALLVKPKILILDDSTSSVDSEIEAKIQKELEKIMANRTCFVVAQRISTVLKADKIVVLDEGRIVAEGAHRELMDSSPIYREIYESQLGDRGSKVD
jgi:ATP-binding cassette subfamily B multidrug efflux pump